MNFHEMIILMEADWKKAFKNAALMTAFGLPVLPALTKSDIKKPQITNFSSTQPTKLIPQPFVKPLITTNPDSIENDSKEIGDYIGTHEGKRKKVSKELF